ncbi:MazG nucleotide pyrophosphohydrolase domain-containing protein [Lysinibacter sp. HNR]|uniref:MazG nucleotide pyrophosphohydrolase domain-containing protein n=1 Tax=Lysinibacter sp. HNR TaxID=3031408 RepID=UPI0024359BFD|nr:MazG nucleotide pyrophosphohydrolase domain-containing protein [Lysinibacter sp. HNR]WGD38234.1 MazG nucleotide pyrophosphohydrolase domain-containing protein [Lysinibacter sp. HNR]
MDEVNDVQSVEALVQTIHRLRIECPWHEQQTATTLVSYLIEECYELIEAIESGNADAIHEELGDLLYQVVLHSEILGENTVQQAGQQQTVIYDVVDQLEKKLRYRHPHVFGDAGPTTVGELNAGWEQMKQRRSKGAPSRMILEGVPLSMPALALADKILERAERNQREINVQQGERHTLEENFGDALLEIVIEARHHGIRAEDALRSSLRRLVQELARPPAGGL